MPSGIYPHKSRTEETKRKISKAIMGHPLYNTGRTHFKKGLIPWNKDKKYPQFSKENHPNWGKKASEETRQKSSISHKGQKSYMEGKHHTEETKKRLSEYWKGKRIGTQHPNWQNGKSFEPYSLDFNDELKAEIRKRDNYICQNCNMTEEEHLIVYGDVLYIHHINYNKKDSDEDNLITLCNSCNARANFNRDYWKNYYSSKRVCNGVNQNK